MIYLFFGPDQFQIEEKVNQMKADFIKKTGTNFNIFTFTPDVGLEKFREAIETENLMSAQKLIICKNYFFNQNVDDQKKILKLLQNSPQTSQIIIIETEKENLTKSALNKLVQKIGRAENFPLLSYSQLRIWIQKRFWQKKAKADAGAINTLVFFIGPDLRKIDLEIEKLANFKPESLILKEDVEILTPPQISPGIFKLIDNIAEKNWQKSYQILDQMLQLGENPLYIHNMICYQFRNLILIKNLLDKDYTQTQIISETKLHPFVVEKTIRQAQNFNFQKLKKIYSKLLLTDLSLKRKDKDPILILDLLVAGLTK